APCETAVFFGPRSVAAGPPSPYDHALRDLFRVDGRVTVAEGHRIPKDDQVNRAKRLHRKGTDDEELVSARLECGLRVRDESTEQRERGSLCSVPSPKGALFLDGAVWIVCGERRSRIDDLVGDFGQQLRQDGLSNGTAVDGLGHRGCRLRLPLL